MSAETFTRLADSIAAMTPHPSVLLHGLGEPLLDPQLESRIRQLRERNIQRAGFATNGRLMGSARARSIIGAGASLIEFSFNSLGDTEVLGNIMNFLDWRDALESSARVQVYYILTPQNRHALKAYMVYFAEHLRGGWDSLRVGEQHNFGGRYPSKILPSRVPCWHRKRSLVYHWDGRKAMCCADVHCESRPWLRCHRCNIPNADNVVLCGPGMYRQYLASRPPAWAKRLAKSACRWRAWRWAVEQVT
jgi:hypothetical protein